MSKYRVWIEIDEEQPNGEYDDVEVLWGPTCEVDTLEEAQAVAMELHEIGKDLLSAVMDDDFAEHFAEGDYHELDDLGNGSVDDDPADLL